MSLVLRDLRVLELTGGSHPAVSTAFAVTFELDSDHEGACRFTDACRLASIAPSFGGVETLIEMPAVMSFWDRTPEERAELDIRDALVRLSCGIEDADIVADLDQALQQL